MSFISIASGVLVVIVATFLFIHFPNTRNEQKMKNVANEILSLAHILVRSIFIFHTHSVSLMPCLFRFPIRHLCLLHFQPLDRMKRFKMPSNGNVQITFVIISSFYLQQPFYCCFFPLASFSWMREGFVTNRLLLRFHQVSVFHCIKWAFSVLHLHFTHWIEMKW